MLATSERGIQCPSFVCMYVSSISIIYCLRWSSWIGVFSADNQNGQIESSHQGAIDLPKIKELATNILEGGGEKPSCKEKKNTEQFNKIYKESSTIEKGFNREGYWLYPLEVVREVVANALAHRDWTQVNEVEIAIYNNRLEVISPGAMNNSMTLEKMLAGQRSPHNQIIMEILRDYGYVDSRGMGVRTKVVPLMRKQNNADPEFVLTDDYLKTILPV